MTHKAKTPARPPVRSGGPRKTRRRRRRNPALERRTFGHQAGVIYSLAAERWRPRGAQTRALMSPMSGGNTRVVRRLGERIYGRYTQAELANKKQQARRTRRRNAVLAQEGRRRGIFVMRAATFTSMRQG